MKKIIVLTLFIIYGSMAWAAEKSDLDLNSLLQQMELQEKRIKSLSLSFSQELLITSTEESQKIAGTALFKKPDNFQIIHTQPREQWTICNGKNIWIWWPQEKKVLKQDFAAWEKSENFPVGLFPIGVPVKKIKQAYQISLVNHLDNTYQLDFSPRTENSYTIKTWISGINFLPKKLELSTAGLTITTVIENLEMNPRAPDNLFSFQIPSGAEIIEGGVQK
ncbi:MAG: outer-membrane lipoprotein carrier protein LolA [Elusimicrobiota bacterium]